MSANPIECRHGGLRGWCSVCDHEETEAEKGRAAAIEAAARKLFTAKGRYHSQIAMCELGELLGYPVVWPVKKSEGVK